MDNISTDLLLLFVGLFIAGTRAIVSKWLVLFVVRFIKKFVMRTAEDWKLYWHYYHEEYRKRLK